MFPLEYAYHYSINIYNHSVINTLHSKIDIIAVAYPLAGQAGHGPYQTYARPYQLSY